MRAYFFAHSYLSGIQKGIQAQHCTSEIFRRYQHMSALQDVQDTLIRWADRYKTTIILNGGDSVVLQQLSTRIELYWKHLRLPWGYFNEDASVNYAITCVGIIVPERIYAPLNPVDLLTAEEQWLYQELSSRSLAQ